jgi:hypothetical protein
MRRAIIVLALACSGWAGQAAAVERPLEELPHDAWDAATGWAQPIKSSARRVDPISRLWLGMLEGSVRSVERTAGLLMYRNEPDAGQKEGEDSALLKYSF